MEKSEKRYRLVIADDENTIRKGICKFIDWNKIGFEVVADFEDGKELLEYIQHQPVDVVLTDIRMAEVNGLQVAKYIYDNHLPVKVVIISGYKEFEYARQALELNVENYILKPIQIEEIEKTFQKIYQQLEENEYQLSHKKEIEEDMLELLPELQEQFWQSILLGGLRKKENIVKKRDVLGLKFDINMPCAVLMIRIKMDPKKNKEYYNDKYNRYNLLNNVFSGASYNVQYYPVYLPKDQLKVVAVANDEISRECFEKQMHEQIVQRVREIETILSLTMDYKIEHTFDNFDELVEYYTSMQVHPLQKNKKECQLNEDDHERLLQKYQLLIDTVNNGDMESLDRQIGNIMFELRNLPLKEMKMLLIDMFSMMLQRFMKMNQEIWRYVKEIVDYTRIMEATDKEKLKIVCLEFLHEIKETVGQNQNEITKNIIDQITDYIKEHYAEEISLDLLADIYFLNPSYLSRIFKQYRGVGLTDYLIELRMEKAKELLLTGKYKVYEISQKVGYKSDKYFFRVFKSYTGLSPLEYCRRGLQ